MICVFAGFLALAPISVKSQQIAIGNVLDSATSLSHSFAIYELFRSNPLVKSGTDTLKPVLMDYALGHDYGITGTFNSTTNDFRIYVKGKKHSDISTQKSWREIYNQLSALFIEQGYLPPKRFASVGEGSVDKIGEKSIRECLPGSVTYDVPATSRLAGLEQHLTLTYYRVKDSRALYGAVRENFGAHSTYKENDIFFFRNSDVPSDLKTIARPLVYPSYRTLKPTLVYLAAGTALAENNALGPALNSLMTTLYTSNKVIASPLERALIRKTAFEEISNINSAGIAGRKEMAALFSFAAKLNDAFLSSDSATAQKRRYYDGVQQIADICVPAETKAKEIRGTKRLGGFLAAVSTAGAFATISPYDNSVSNALLDQASQTLSQYSEQANSASQLLSEQFANVSETIHSETFTIGGESITDIGKPVIALEAGYYLSKYPHLMRLTLDSFAADKPTLKTRVNEFYTLGFDNDKALYEVVKQIAHIETVIVNLEVRGKSISEKAKESF